MRARGNEFKLLSQLFFGRRHSSICIIIMAFVGCFRVVVIIVAVVMVVFL